jgi:hypothetical protein
VGKVEYCSGTSFVARSVKVRRKSQTKLNFDHFSPGIPNRCAAALQCAVKFQKCASKFRNLE